MTVDRQGFCEVLNAFDAARGRGYSFILPEFSYVARVLGVLDDKVFLEPANVTGESIEELAQGFEEWSRWILDAGYIVLCRADGTKLLGKVTETQDEVTSWSVTVDQSFDEALPANLLQIAVPARRSHFRNDSLEEDWISPCGCEVSFSTEEDISPIELQ